MKVLVVGGAGYIGSHTVYELIRAGHEVSVLDNLSTGHRSFVPKDVKFYEGDIRVKEDVDNVLSAEKFDVVMHFAANIVVPESMEKPLAYYHNNVEGVRILLLSMVEHNVKKLVFSSTAAVYGDAKGVCYEDDILNPINPYGETKLAVEKMIKWTAQAHNMSYVIFRYFNVAGADKTMEIGLKSKSLTHLIPVAINQALNDKVLNIYGDDYQTPDGTCVRDYIHVTDLAQAHVLGADYLNAGNQSSIFNLGSNSGFSVLEVANSVQKIIPLKYQIAERRPGDPAILIASTEKAKEILKWEPKLKLDDMIKSDLAYRKKLK